MQQLAIDLFAEELAAARNRPAPVSQAGQLSLLVPPTEMDYGALLEKLLADADRKNALRAMAPERVTLLACAVAVVARAKRRAYDRARTGEHLSSFDWVNRAPDEALATNFLNQAFVDINGIPMAPPPPSEDI